MFNKETEYALRALVFIQVQNLRGARPGVYEITKGIDAPRFYTAKILQRMVKNGFIVSAKGKGGGFYFDTQKSELPLKDLINATEGTKIFSGCGFGLKNCDGENPCPFHEEYALIREALGNLVSTATIQSLARNFEKSV